MTVSSSETRSNRFVTRFGRAEMTMAFMPSGELATTHRYDGAAVKRVEVRVGRKGARLLLKWLLTNIPERGAEEDAG